MTGASGKLFFLVVCIFLLAACDEQPASPRMPAPPDAEQREQIVAAPGGDRTDPYYWLRDDSRRDPELLALLEAENAYTREWLDSHQSLVEQLVDEMRQRVVDHQLEAPYFDDGYWYYTRFEKDAEYPIYARRKGSMEASEEILLDGHRIGQNEDYFRVGGLDVSPDGKRLAWLQDVAGKRQFRLMIRTLGGDHGRHGKVVDTGINGVSSASWAADGNSIIYVETDPETLRPYRVKLHFPLASNNDETLFEERDAAFYVSVGRTRSDRFNYVFSRSGTATEMRVIDGSKPGASLEVFLPRSPDHQYTADHADGRWIIRSNWRAPNFRIMQVDEGAHADRAAWTELVPHRDDIFILEFDAFAQHLAIAERTDGLRRLRIVDLADGSSEVVGFDESVHAAQLGRNPEPAARAVQIAYTSMTTPREIHELDLATGKRSLVGEMEVGGDFDASNYRTRRVWAEARDGVSIPVSLAWHRDTQLDGSAPLYQYAYGAYGSSTEAAFSSERISLLDRGFVYAIAHVRGGQEMGRDWYDQGRLMNKLNSFTDFIDVTTHLVELGMVDGNRVFAAGKSAGGLLVGAVANMAPEKYAGVVAHAPFVDVVTTMLDESIPLTTHEFDEWGDPKQPEHYRYMLGYSPYDNVAARAYPAILVTTGLWDAQVQYWEPLKWVARLRDVKTDANPLLLHVDMDAGHGGQTGRFNRLRRTAMEYAFVIALAGAN